MSLTRGLRQVRVLLSHELRLELRTRESLWTAGLFAAVLLTVFLFSGFDEKAIALRAFPGVLWVSLAFVGSVIFARSFQRERESGVLNALLLVPGAVSGLFVARTLTNALLLVLIELLLVPVAAGAFGVRLSLAQSGTLALIVGLGTAGYAVMGTVLSAALSTMRLRDVLLPIVLFPLTIPLLIAGVRATAALTLDGDVNAALEWMGLMIAFDVVFLIVGRWLFEQTMDPAVAQQ